MSEYVNLINPDLPQSAVYFEAVCPVGGHEAKWSNRMMSAGRLETVIDCETCGIVVRFNQARPTTEIV